MIESLGSLSAPATAAAAGLLCGLAEAAPRVFPPYRPFLTPLPVWDYWPWMLLPLCVAVAVVYKSIKCRRMSQVPREAAVLMVWILAGMVGAAAVLAAVVKLVEYARS